MLLITEIMFYTGLILKQIIYYIERFENNEIFGKCMEMLLTTIKH